MTFDRHRYRPSTQNTGRCGSWWCAARCWISSSKNTTEKLKSYVLFMVRKKNFCPYVFFFFFFKVLCPHQGSCESSVSAVALISSNEVMFFDHYVARLSEYFFFVAHHPQTAYINTLLRHYAPSVCMSAFEVRTPSRPAAVCGSAIASLHTRARMQRSA